MRLTVFSYVYKPEQFLINEFCADLVKRNHQVQVFTGLPNYPQGEFYSGYGFFKGPYQENIDGVLVTRYPILPRKKGFFFLALNYLSHMFFATLSLFRVKKSDVYFIFATSPITTAIPAILLSKITGTKICLWLQDLWPESVAAVGAMGEKSFLYKIIGLLVRWIYKRVDLIMIQSPSFRDNLKEFGYTGSVLEIPNWAPEFDNASGQEPAWLSDFPKDFTVTFAGNIGKAQAVETILKASEILKSDASFVFVGDGSELDFAKKFVQEHGLTNVKFYGRRPLSDMPALFQKSSALLVSLSKDPIFEKTIPSKMQAYMSLGRPILGSLDGIGAKIVEDWGIGFSSPAEDAERLAQNVLRLKSLSQEERAQLGNSAHSHFYQNYRKDLIIDRIEKHLKEF